MVFDAHDRAFALFKGTCGRGIYDNMKTAVETIFVGKDRLYNRRFQQMCSHYLVDPVARTPASGWEKGQAQIDNDRDSVGGSGIPEVTFLPQVVDRVDVGNDGVMARALQPLVVESAARALADDRRIGHGDRAERLATSE
jgi:hypothetical protein